MMSRPKLAFMTLLTMLALTACGIRPGNLTPPKGDEKDNFPHIYPNDPKDPNKKDHNR